MENVRLDSITWSDGADARRPLVWLPVVLGLILLAFLPLAVQFHYPGGFHPSFRYCMSASILLIVVNLGMLFFIPSHAPGRRIAAYLSLGMAVFVLAFLYASLQWENEFVYWAPQGIYYRE